MINMNNTFDFDKFEKQLEEMYIEPGPEGYAYLGFGEWYNFKTRKFSRTSTGAFQRFPDELYED